MKNLLIAVAAICLMATPVFAQHRTHPGPKSVHPQRQPQHFKPQPHHIHPQHIHPNHDFRGPQHNCGRYHRGVTYSHYCYTHVWVYQYRCWYPTWGIYLYWCPVQCCWYRYDTIYMIYLPCDTFINPACPGIR